MMALPQGKQQKAKSDTDFTEVPSEQYNSPQLNSPLSSSSGQSSERQTISLTADLWTLVSVLTFLADVASDLYVSSQYWREHNYWWFGFSLGFVLAASLTMQVFSAKWFYDDRKRQNCLTYTLHILQMGPVVRYWTTVKLCWRARCKKGIHRGQDLFVAEWRDLSMLRLLQAFLQCAPQLVLQLYVIARRHRFTVENDLSTAISAGTSLISIIWAIISYSKALRDMKQDPGNLPWLGFVFQILWRTCMITSRVVALVLFASYFTHWMFVAAAAHWLLMTMWLSCQRTQFCIDESGKEHPCREKLFNAIIAFIYIFCFFNTKEGMTRKRVVLFYSVMLVENSLLISMWYPHRTLSVMLTYVALAIVWGGFVLGVIFMVLYYRFYHHSQPYKGILLRQRKFTFHGKKMHGLYFCCCCRIRKWELSEAEYAKDCDPRLLLKRPMYEEQGYQAVELEIIPRVPSQESGIVQGNLNWDNGDIQPPNGTCVSGSNVVVHNGHYGPVAIGIDLRRLDEDVSPEDVPDIVIIAATPTVLSPRDSPRHSFARKNTVEDLNKEASSKEPKQDVPVDDIDTDKELKSPTPSCTSADVARKILADKLGKLDNPQDNEVFDDQDEVPKINYGLVSFSNRYSLVSSDCISLSSGSSFSSFNSLNDLLDRAGSTTESKSNGNGVKASTADEGIFSDDRESPTKVTSEKTTDKDPIVFLKDVKKIAWRQDSSLESRECVMSSQDKNGAEMIELIMDAPSSPESPRKTSQSSGKDEHSERGERSESESTESSSEGTSSGRDRRHSCDGIYVAADMSSSSSLDDVKKRHSFDIAELSRNMRQYKQKGKKRRKYKNIILFDNFVASPLKAGRFSSLRKSFERLSKIQEDTEESSLLSDETLQLITMPTSEEEKEENIDTMLIDDQHSPGNETSDENNTTASQNVERESREVASPISMKPVHSVPTNNKLWQRAVLSKNKQEHGYMRLSTEERERGINSKAKSPINGDVQHSVAFGVCPEGKKKEPKHETNKRARSLDEDLHGPPGNASPKRQRVRPLLVDELVPSRFSTVRRSREAVPLACAENFEDFDDLDDELDDVDEFEIKRASSSLPNVSHHNLSSETDSKDDYECDISKDIFCTRSLERAESSGSSVFENPLFSGAAEAIKAIDLNSLDRRNKQELEKRAKEFNNMYPVNFPDRPLGSYMHKRHTFDFGSAQQGGNRVKRLNGSTSQPLYSGADNPVWVHKADTNYHQRQRPISDVFEDVLVPEGVIQEVRV